MLHPRFSSRNTISTKDRDPIMEEEIKVEFDPNASMPHQQAKLQEIFNKYSGPVDPTIARLVKGREKQQKVAIEYEAKTPPKR